MQLTKPFSYLNQNPVADSLLQGLQTGGFTNVKDPVWRL